MTTLEHPEWERENSLTSPEDRIRENRWRPDTGIPSLTNEQTEAAMKELNITSFVERFPRADRAYADPPVPLQKIGLISFTPAKGARPNDNGVYGYAKLRGNFETPIEANQRAEELIKHVDSYHKLYHMYVGRPFPITLSSQYSETVSEVDMRKQATESISANIKQTKQDEEKEIEEMRRREEQLLAESEKAKKDEVVEDPEDKYVTLQVKRAQLCWTFLEHAKKMDEVRSIIIKTRRELAEMDVEHPDFRGLYYKKYMDARKKSGLDTKVRSSQDNFIKYMVEDVFLPGIDDLPKDTEPTGPFVPPVGFAKYNPDAVPEPTPTTSSQPSPPVQSTAVPESVSRARKNKKKNKKKNIAN